MWLTPHGVSRVSANADGDRRAGLVWRHTSGLLAIWFMRGMQVVGTSLNATITDGLQVLGGRSSTPRSCSTPTGKSWARGDEPRRPPMLTYAGVWSDEFASATAVGSLIRNFP